MSVRKQLRRGALGIAITALGVLAVTGTAFAGDVSVGGSGLTYTGDATAETLTVNQTAATVVTFDLAGAPVTTSDPACVASNTNTADADNEVTCTLAGLEAIVAAMDAGNDVVTATTTTFTSLAGQDGDDRLDVSAATFAGDGPTSAPPGNITQGGAGNDTLIGGAAPGNLWGDDFGFGGTATGNDTINGGAGDEFLSGGPGLDTLNGGAGDDTLDGGSVTTFAPSFSDTSDGADTVNGGDGADTVTYAGRTVAVTVDLTKTAGQGQATENDSLTNVENITGGDAGDTLTGDKFSNVISGNDGTDTIAGGLSFDEVHGGRDADNIQMAGDVTADLIDCGRGFSSTTTGATTTTGSDTDVTKLDYLDYLSTGSDCETVTRNLAPARAPQLGTGEDDIITGDGNRDLLIGLDGNDQLFGLNDSDELQGGFGNDRLIGGNGPDDLLAGFGNDGVNGGPGNDEINGGPGTDYLIGGDGVDTISGGEGVDRLDGGLGRDNLLARDDVRDTVVCSVTRVASQQDVVFADPEDRIVNARFCARIAIS